jgi:hypothetical protein
MGHLEEMRDTEILARAAAAIGAMRPFARHIRCQGRLRRVTYNRGSVAILNNPPREETRWKNT